MNSILIKNIRAVDMKNDNITDVFIENGKISRMDKNIDVMADRVIDGTDLVLMPSLFDMHVHFRDPGHRRCDAWLRRYGFPHVDLHDLHHCDPGTPGLSAGLPDPHPRIPPRQAHRPVWIFDDQLGSGYDHVHSGI